MMDKKSLYTKDDLYKVNIDYTKEKKIYEINLDSAKQNLNHLKKEFVEASIYYYIEEYKQSVNQLINNNIEFANNLYYEFVITDKFLIDNINVLPCIEYNQGLHEHKYALGSNIIIHAYNTLIVHIN